jgi:putative ABC transport system permease protein
MGERYGLRVIPSRELVAYYAEQVGRAFSGVDVLGGLVLIVILVGLADTLIAAVLERRRHLAAIRAVGVSARQVEHLVVVEGILVALTGLALALAGGILLGVLWAKATFPSLLGWALELHIPYARLAGGMAAALSVALAASLLPARMAGKLDPSVALRYD